MELIERLKDILEEGQRRAEESDFFIVENREKYGESNSENKIFHGDNIKVMNHLISNGYEGKFKCIYIDPPFFSGANYDAVVKLGNKSIKHQAYKDTWQDGMYDYLVMITARLYLLRRLLSDDGLLWIHLDWHVVHYVKLLMDCVFGSKSMINEIIWQYKSGGSSKRHFSRKHENILLYSKTSSYNFYPLKEKSYNRDFKPYNFKGVAEYKDNVGWYTMVNMKDVWSIDMVGRTSQERTGYATQKPEKLLERIIEASTHEGDLVADFFMGSGTLCSVAGKKDRKFIGCDVGALAVESTVKRLTENNISFELAIDKESSNNKFKVNFEAEKIKIGENNLISEEGDGLRLKIKSIVEPNLLTLIPNKSFEEAAEALKKGSLDFLSYVAIDCDYDGQIMKPKLFDLAGEKMDMIEFPRVHAVKLKFCDVFGNRFYVEL